MWTSWLPIYVHTLSNCPRIFGSYNRLLFQTCLGGRWIESTYLDHLPSGRAWVRELWKINANCKIAYWLWPFARRGALGAISNDNIYGFYYIFYFVMTRISHSLKAILHLPPTGEYYKLYHAACTARESLRLWSRHSPSQLDVWIVCIRENTVPIFTCSSVPARMLNICWLESRQYTSWW